jgi:ribosomal protein L37AE/L43A
LVSMSVASGSAQVARPKHWNPLHHKPQIQLAVYEEHRCPYCLEEVKRDDPRGVVECEVCHTLHHKDCWDITGACQVPHLNT